MWRLSAVLWGLIPEHLLLAYFVSAHFFVLVCAFMSVSAGERGKRWHGARWSLLSLTQHLSHFIIKSPVTNSSGNRQRWGRQEKSCDESGGGHPGAESTASLMQLVCVTSNVTLTWCSHPCVIFRYGRGAVTVLQTPTVTTNTATPEWLQTENVWWQHNQYRLWLMKQCDLGKQVHRNNEKLIQSRGNVSTIEWWRNYNSCGYNGSQLKGKFYLLGSLFRCVEDSFDQQMLFGPPCAGCAVRGECYPSLMRNAKALLRLCEGEQISLIDGYKMLRTELEVQRARALEWNGVHSWVTSLFQWCSKRRINPPNSLCTKYNLGLVMEPHTRQQA